MKITLTLQGQSVTLELEPMHEKPDTSGFKLLFSVNYNFVKGFYKNGHWNVINYVSQMNTTCVILAQMEVQDYIGWCNQPSIVIDEI